MNAIILAAGLGSRFKEITQTTHKALLDIHGIPNLERTLAFLRQANIDNIVIVTGYLHEQFNYLQEKYNCTLIHNEKYREYNSIYSFSLAQDFFNDCYVIDADVVLNRNIFLTKPSHSKYFTVIRSKTHNEWLPILNSNGQVIRIDIGSLNQPSLSGISFWTTQDCNTILNLLKDYLSEVRLKNPKLYWDTIPMEYIEKLNIYTEQLNSDDIFEMDNLDDYHHILQKFDTKQGKIMKKLTLREQQLVCLDILDYFHTLCERYKISYSLGGGTLIGAIRHKGFIPWDDDIDVYMHRDEYQRFVDVWFQETHEYYNMETAEDILAQYTGEMAKIFDCRTQITDAKGRKSPMFMDIFIYDGVPNEPKIIYPLMKKHRRIKLRFSSCKKRWLRSKENTLQRTILDKLSHFLFSKMQKNLAQFQIKYPIKQCDYIGLVLSDYGGWQKSYMPKEYFNHVIYKEFEGRQFQVMNGYHEHLTQYYGEYMKLPPEEDQKPHHIQEAYIL